MDELAHLVVVPCHVRDTILVSRRVLVLVQDHQDKSC